MLNLFIKICSIFCFTTLTVSLVSCSDKKSFFDDGYEGLNRAIPSEDNDSATDVETDYFISLKSGVHKGTSYQAPLLELDSAINHHFLSKEWIPKPDNLIHYWNCESNGVDQIGNADLQLFSNASYTSDSKIGDYSCSVDGSNSYFRSTSNISISGAAPRSISTWFYPISSSGRQTIFQMGGSTATHFALEYNGHYGGAQTLTFLGWSRNVYSNLKIDLNTWNHIMITFDGTSDSVQFYLNGQKIHSTVVNSGAISVLATPISFGYDAYNNRQPFHGRFDEMAIWDIVLSADEVDFLYKRQKAKISGSYTSETFAKGAKLNLTQSTVFPYGKSLPSVAEKSSSYSDILNDYSNSLELLLHFDGTIRDDSENNFNLILNGLSKAPGLFNESISLNGSSGHIRIDNFSDMNAFSFSVWVFSDEKSGAYFPIFEQTNQDLARKGVGLDASGYPILFIGDFRHFKGTTRVPLGRWVHLAGTYDGSNYTLYMDGVEQTLGGEITSASGNIANRLMIGRSVTSSINQFRGFIDELILWSRSLSKNEVESLYKRGVASLKYQVRFCYQADCSDGVWRGIDETGLSYLSESHNRFDSNGIYSVERPVSHKQLKLDLANLFTDHNLPYMQVKLFFDSNSVSGFCSTGNCLPSIQALKLE